MAPHHRDTITANLLMRTVYFDKASLEVLDPEWTTPRMERAAREEELRFVNLRAVASAVGQLSQLVEQAPRVKGEHPDPQTELALARHKVVSIEMGSPLVITIALSTTAVTGALTALVMLAERLAVFRPRIVRERKEELLRVKQIDREAARLESERADDIARALARGWATPRPISMDFFDPDSDDDDLEEI